MTPVTREKWKINVCGKKAWNVIFNSDDKKYYGAGRYDEQPIITKIVDKKSNLYEINLHLPALAAIVLI